jgi:hypothetical protein
MQHSLSPLAEDEIAALEADGISLTPHDIIHIAALGEQVMNPQTRQELARGRPVPVGGTYLWPLTLSAYDWWDRIGDKLTTAWERIGIYWPSMDRRMLALAYAMAHGHEPLPENPREAVKAIKEWRRTKLHCTLNELREAIALAQQQETVLDTGGNDDASATRGQLVMMLSAMTGIRPQVWQYQCSFDFGRELLETITLQADADGKSLKDAQSINANKALGLAADRIRKRHKREQAANG